MSKLLYDNIDDVQSKLAGTIIYYGKQPVVVKQIQYDEDDPNPVINHKFTLFCSKTLTSRSGYTEAKLDDPLLNYKQFNLGYANYEHGTVWWYRTPAKQYRQGLKADQLKYKVGDGMTDFGYGFHPSKQIEAMLMNQYPDMETIHKAIIDEPGRAMAMHKDFAVRWDRIHRDMIIDYKGRSIGCADKNFNDIRLVDEHAHLIETMKEVLNVR